MERKIFFRRSFFLYSPCHYMRAWIRILDAPGYYERAALQGSALVRTVRPCAQRRVALRSNFLINVHIHNYCDALIYHTCMCQMGCIICADCESVIFVNRTHHCHTPLHVQLTAALHHLCHFHSGCSLDCYCLDLELLLLYCLLWGFLQSSLHAHFIVHG